MKQFRKLLGLVLAVVLVASLCVPALAADTDDRIRNRYNVVFVTDESGSMATTDPNHLRYEAIRRFVALMAQHGNYVGSVNFHDAIALSQNVAPVDGFAEKEAFVKNLRMEPVPGWTNIGLSLLKAVEMLNEGGNPDNPSVIILLTDGNTAMGTDEETQTSLEQKAEAIEQARQAGYQIYTISLNTDGTAASSELQQIASATGGEFQEVTSAEDLEEIQTMYYKMIFGIVEGDDAEDMKINNDGFAEKEFEIPGIGVEEFNVLLEGSISSYELINPAGYSYNQDELKAMTMSGRDFTVLKVENPDGGVWKVRVYGDPGASVNFRLLYNSDFYIQTAVDPASGYKLDQTVTFHATVCDRTGPISDPAKYAGFVAELRVTFGGSEEVYPMELGSDGFYYDLTLSEQGTYYAEISARNNECLAAPDQTFQIDVDNNAPVATGEELKAHANLWPFIGGSAELDLSAGASEPDGEPLTFSVESSAFMPEDYTLDGTKLTLSNYSISKGSFDIRATDPHGAYCVFPVSFTSTNIGMVMAILTVIGILIALIVVFLLARKLAGTPFMGSISVEAYDAESSSYTNPSVMETPGRGRVKLSRFEVGECGLPAGAYFQAGGKDKHIYFVSKQPVYSDAAAGPSKKIAIDGNGLEVLICTDATLSKGVRVSFRSMLNNQFDF